MTNSTDKGLKLITSNPKQVMAAKCVVTMDNTKTTYDNFVVVAYDKETDKTVLVQFADALTVGQAMMMLHQAFEIRMAELSEEQQGAVLASLGAM